MSPFAEKNEKRSFRGFVCVTFHNLDIYRVSDVPKHETQLVHILKLNKYVLFISENLKTGGKEWKSAFFFGCQTFLFVPAVHAALTGGAVWYHAFYQQQTRGLSWMKF